MSEYTKKVEDPREQIGQRLKQAREEQGITLEQAQERSKIRAECLEALERGDFDALPNPLWARGLTITYAESLRLEGNALAETLSLSQRYSQRKKHGARHLPRRIATLMRRHWRALTVALGVTAAAVAVTVGAVVAPYNRVTNETNNFLHRLAPDVFLGSGPQRVVVLASTKVGTTGEGSVMAVKVSEEGLGVLAIPKNTLVQIPGHGTGEIGDTATLEGPDLTRRATAQLTGIEVPHYLAISAEGVREVVDKMGGVQVDVPHPISGRASINGRQVTLDPGPQKLDSDEALVYLQGEDLPGDAERAKRQQAFLNSMLGQALSVENLLSDPATLNAVLDRSETNMSGLEAVQLAARLRALKSSGASLQTQVIPGQEGGVASQPGDQWVPDERELPDALKKTLQ